MKHILTLICLLLPINSFAMSKTGKILLGIGLTVVGIALIAQQPNNTNKVSINEVTAHSSPFNNGYANRSWLETNTNEVTIDRKEDPTSRQIFGGLMAITGILIAF